MFRTSFGTSQLSSRLKNNFGVLAVSFNFVVGRVQNMEDMNGEKNERVETWTEDEVFDFISEHFSKEVASKFKGMPKALISQNFPCPKSYKLLHACKLKT